MTSKTTTIYQEILMKYHFAGLQLYEGLKVARPVFGKVWTRVFAKCTNSGFVPPGLVLWHSSTVTSQFSIFLSRMIQSACHFWPARLFSLMVYPVPGLTCIHKELQPVESSSVGARSCHNYLSHSAGSVDCLQSSGMTHCVTTRFISKSMACLFTNKSGTNSIPEK